MQPDKSNNDKMKRENHVRCLFKNLNKLPNLWVRKAKHVRTRSLTNISFQFQGNIALFFFYPAVYLLPACIGRRAINLMTKRHHVSKCTDFKLLNSSKCCHIQENFADNPQNTAFFMSDACSDHSEQVNWMIWKGTQFVIAALCCAQLIL